MEIIVKHFNELTTGELYEILKTRFEIFVTEQECLYQDLDDKDQDAIHVFCWNDEGRVAGCLRVFMRDAEHGIVQIGRVVTLEHGKGVGGKILKEGVKVATKSFNAKKIYLEAQVYAIGYYAKEGFEVVSDEFMEDGIPHVKMEKIVPTDDAWLESRVLRPHHGMCFQFYEGKGYSEDFTDHMGRIIREMEADPAQKVRLKAETDIVCENCPNNEAGECSTAAKVKRYDKEVLKAIGIAEGDESSFAAFTELVKEKIIDAGIRSDICGDCSWDYICREKDIPAG